MRGCPGGMAGAWVGMSLCGLKVLSAESALLGQLNLKWVQAGEFQTLCQRVSGIAAEADRVWAGASWGAVCREHPDRTAAAKVGMGRSGSRVLHIEGTLEGQLKL